MRGFKEEEYQERSEKLKFLMEQKDIMALIITSPSNFRYFTGFDSNFWESPTRPWFLLIPMNQDPIAIIPSIGKAALEKMGADLKNGKKPFFPQYVFFSTPI